MIAILTTALFFAAGALAFHVLMRDSANLLRRYGAWDAELVRIDRAAMCDPAAFSLRRSDDLKRGVPARSTPAFSRRAAA